MKTGIVSALAAAALLAGCGGRPSVAGDTAPAAAKADWRDVATPEDRTRLRNWRAAWTSALDKVRGSDKRGELAKHAALFDPDRALADPAPPPGAYRCRWFKLGAKGTAMADFTAYPYFQCRIDDEGDVASFYKDSGSQRPVGLLFDDGAARSVFLGTLMLGDETRPMEYGRDASRDMAGFVERIGDKSWRLVLPYPQFESVLDVIELVPAGAS